MAQGCIFSAQRRVFHCAECVLLRVTLRFIPHGACFIPPTYSPICPPTARLAVFLLALGAYTAYKTSAAPQTACIPEPLRAPNGFRPVNLPPAAQALRNSPLFPSFSLTPTMRVLTARDVSCPHSPQSQFYPKRPRNMARRTVNPKYYKRFLPQIRALTRHSPTSARVRAEGGLLIDPLICAFERAFINFQQL